MPEPMSTHLPATAGGEVEVIGEVSIDTRLKDIRTAQVSFKTTNFVANEESKVSWYFLDQARGKIAIRVEKGGSNEGILGTNPVIIAWLAIGDR